MNVTADAFSVAASKLELEEGSKLAPRFDANGLVTAVVTDFESGNLLMVAHMNAEALHLTIETRVAHYFSRSRGTLWKKGESSGALQAVREIRVDCDQDALWLKVDVITKPEDTCHTGRTNCFYRKLDLEGGGSVLLETEQKLARSPISKA